MTYFLTPYYYLFRYIPLLLIMSPALFVVVAIIISSLFVLQDSDSAWRTRSAPRNSVAIVAARRTIFRPTGPVCSCGRRGRSAAARGSVWSTRSVCRPGTAPARAKRITTPKLGHARKRCCVDPVLGCSVGGGWFCRCCCFVCLFSCLRLLLLLCVYVWFVCC